MQALEKENDFCQRRSQPPGWVLNRGRSYPDGCGHVTEIGSYDVSEKEDDFCKRRSQPPGVLNHGRSYPDRCGHVTGILTWIVTCIQSHYREVPW